MPYRITSAEFTRLAALYRYGVLATPAELAYDTVLRDLALSLGVPMAQLVFADAHRFWAKSTVGPAPVESLRGGSLADLLVTDLTTLAVADTEAPGRIAGDLPACELRLRSYAGMRIASPEEDAVGVLQVADTRPRDFSPAETAAIEAAVHKICILLESQRRQRHDEDTGALRRDAFAQTVGQMVAATRIGGQRISLVRLDLAAFRASLEEMGTGLGRIALRRTAEIGLRQVRRRDCFGRVGYDTFAVLLSDTGEAGARILANRLSDHLLQGWSGSVPNTGTVSVEVVSVKPVAGDEAEATLLAAALGSDPRAAAARRA